MKHSTLGVRCVTILCLFSMLVVGLAGEPTQAVSGQSSQSTPTQDFVKTPETLTGSQIDADLAQTVMQAVSGVAGLNNFGDYHWTIMSETPSFDQTQAVISLALVDSTTGQMLPTEALTVVAHLNSSIEDSNGNPEWQVSIPGQSDFENELKSLPTELQSPVYDTVGQTDNQVESTTTFGGYLLPWAAGTTKAMVQGAHHVTCNVLSDCYYAFDFASKYGDNLKFPLLAAKGGTVYTFYDSCADRDESATAIGTCTNYIVLKDTTTTPTSYQIYLHLSQNTIPAKLQKIGAQVNQGTYIANADNTGASWGSHLHFMVVTTIYNVGYAEPSYPWGVSVDVTFKDVSINWDSATQGGRPCGTSDIGYGKCTQAQYYYVSGNKGANPPTGDLILPADQQTLTDSDLLVGGWGADDLGVTRLSIVVNYNGTWQEVGASQTSTPFAFDLDLCSAGIPDGPFQMALAVWDVEGNESVPLGTKNLIKNIPACPNKQSTTSTVSCSDPSSAQVVLYSKPNFQGNCVTLSQTGGTSNGQYPNGTYLSPVGDDAVESIKVGSAVEALLYQGNNFGPRRETIIGSDRNLSDNRLGNDTVSAVIVADHDSTPANPMLFTIYGPGGASSPSSIDSIILTWGWGDGGESYQAALYSGSYTSNSVCSSSTSPLMSLSWQYGLTWSIGTLSPGTYTWCGQSRSMKANGSYVTSNWYINTFTVTSGSFSDTTPTAAPFSDTMSNGSNHWTASGDWHQTSDPTNSSNTLWAFNNGTDISGSTTENGDLTSQPIAIPSSPTEYLRFSYYRDTETSTPYWDQRWVQVSVDGGAFQNVMQLSDDETKTWLQSPFISLASYANHTIRLRFHFDTIDTLFTSGYTGWYIDNVTINSTTPPTNCSESSANNTPATATAISYGQTISGAICPPGDVDYYAIQATAGDNFTAEVDAQTLSPESALDSELTLYLSPDTSTIVAENDNVDPNGSDLDSFINLTIPQTGTYYLRVKAHDGPGVGGSGYFYKLKVANETDTTEPTISLTEPQSGQYLPGPSVNLTASATDDSGGSGISHVDFYYHGADWTNPDWTLIGSDYFGTDGWQVPFNTSAFSDGSTLSIMAVAVDKAGNSGYAANWSVPIDLTPPQVAFTNAPSTTLAETTFPLAWTASDSGSGLAAITLQYNQDSSGWQNWPTSLSTSTRSAWFVGSFGHQYAFRISATDAAGNSSSYSQISVTTSSSCQKDSYESGKGDNTQANAAAFTLGSTQSHNFCSTGDQDWVTFTVEQGKVYFILAAPTSGSGADPVLKLYAHGQTTLLSQASAVGLGHAAVILWTAPTTGAYDLQTTSLNSSIAGTDITYNLTVAENHPNYLPLIDR